MTKVDADQPTGPVTVDIGDGKTVNTAALQKTIDSPGFDSKTALTAVQDLNKSCNECHKVYRSTDEDGHYMLKPGSVPGY